MNDRHLNSVLVGPANGLTLLCISGVILLLVSVVQARPQYVRQVPTPYSCDTCHLDPNNRNLRTGFGIDFGLNRGVWASDDPEAGICRLDSDRDDLTNGEELGDPDCLWRAGDRLPAGPTTNPADPRDPDRCGDGNRQEGENCDGDDLGESTCVSEGFMEGRLACDGDCQLDLSGCVSFPEPDMVVPPDMGIPDVSATPDVVTPEVDAMPPLPPVDSGTDIALDATEPADSGDTLMGDSMRPTEPRTDGGQLQPLAPEDGGCVVSGELPAHLVGLMVLVGLIRRRRDR